MADGTVLEGANAWDGRASRLDKILMLQTFDPYVIPLLAGPMDLTRWEEM